jgi:hypothetical protein
MKTYHLALLLAATVVSAASLRAGVYPDTPTHLWPGGIIPIQYDNDPSININQRLVLVAAMSAWMSAANVSFVLRTNNEPDYLFIRQGTSGPSYPPPEGYRAGSGAHILNLFYWGTNNNDVSSCTRVFGLAHEVGHVLGLLHTHQSPNRNLFFNVRTNLVVPGFAGNYTIDPDSLVWPRSIPDIDSIMSYPLCTFSICDTNCPGNNPDCNCSINLQNCATILLREPYATDWANPLICTNQCPDKVCVGQRNHLSVWDKAVMSYLYPQPNWRFAEAGSAQVIANGTFHYPSKTFTNGKALVPTGGTLFMEPSTYANSGGVHLKRMTIRSTRIGSVVLRQ